MGKKLNFLQKLELAGQAPGMGVALIGLKCLEEAKARAFASDFFITII